MADWVFSVGHSFLPCTPDNSSQVSTEGHPKRSRSLLFTLR